MKVQKAKAIRTAVVILICLCAAILLSAVCFRLFGKGYTLTTDRQYNYIVTVFSEEQLRQVNIKDMDFYGTYSLYRKHPELNVVEHMGLSRITEHYLEMFPDYDDTWLECSILDCGRDFICVRYSGTYTDENGSSAAIDDNWYIDISSVRDGGYGTVYLNGKEMEM